MVNCPSILTWGHTLILRVFAKTLKRLRKETDVSQELVAEKADISHRTMQELEGARQQPKLLTLFSLADALGITPGELIEDSWQEWVKRKNQKSQRTVGR